MWTLNVAAGVKVTVSGQHVREVPVEFELRKQTGENNLKELHQYTKEKIIAWLYRTALLQTR